MNKPLTSAEVEALAVPIPLPAPAMTKREKLLRFAEIVRGSSFFVGLFGHRFVIFHALEYLNADQLANTAHPQSAFNAAGDDPVLQKAGLKKDIGGKLVSALEAKRFFELDRSELHEFSCDCGGVITDQEMARRIESIAVRS